jgi:hypothetical protein
LEPGTAITIYDCDNGDSQLFIAYDDNTIRAGENITLCVSLPAGTGSYSDGLAVTLEICDGRSRQQWRINSDIPSITTRSNRNFCLDHHDNSLENGGAVVLWTCDAEATTQRWLVTSITLRIRLHDDPTFCVNSPDGASPKNNGSALNLWTCDDAANNGDTGFIAFPDFTVRPQGDVSLCVDLADSGGEWNLKTCDAAANSQLIGLDPIVSTTEDGIVGYVYYGYTNMCLSLASSTATDGGALVPASCSGDDASLLWEVTTKTPIPDQRTVLQRFGSIGELQYQLPPGIGTSIVGPQSRWWTFTSPSYNNFSGAPPGCSTGPINACLCCYLLSILLVVISVGQYSM